MKTKETNNTLKKIKFEESIILILGGTFIKNFYSIALLIWTKEWISISEMIKDFSNKNEMQAIITVYLFRGLGTAFIILGIFKFFKQIYMIMKK